VPVGESRRAFLCREHGWRFRPDLIGRYAAPHG